MAVRRRREKARCAVLAHHVRFVRTVCKDVLSCGAIGPRCTAVSVSAIRKRLRNARRTLSVYAAAPVYHNVSSRRTVDPRNALVRPRNGRVDVRSSLALLAHFVRRVGPVRFDPFAKAARPPHRALLGVHGGGEASDRAVRADPVRHRAPVRLDPFPKHAGRPCRTILSVHGGSIPTVQAVRTDPVRHRAPVRLDVLAH